jgi:DNA-binding MarR family transcriptional regulator
VGGVPTAITGNGSGLTRKQQNDPVQWMRFYWEQQSDDDPWGFLAMTSVLRLHHLMTATLDQQLRNAFNISITDFQILKALQLSENGTWLLSGLARHLMVHATTVTLSIDRLEARQLVKRRSHPHDRRASLVAITAEGRGVVDDATRSLRPHDFGLPGLTPAQARALIATVARVRASAGDLDRSYGSAPRDLG